MIVKILIFRGVPKLYDYTYEGSDKHILGKIVDIPFGRSRAKGAVMAISKNTTISVKNILSFDTKTPPIPEGLLPLIEWFYTYYQCTPYKAFQTIVGKKSMRDTAPPNAHESPPPPYLLNPDQKAAIETILTSPKHFKEFYIHGVTGSGKTEVYMHLAKKMLDDGFTTLILVPEIALTPQYTTLFRERFGDNIAVIHSGLTPKQKDIEWHRIKNGHAHIIIGPRSAIFAPFIHLGAIIIDEEHDPSYKQDSHPRYNTHEIARFRAEKSDAFLIYGSATPRIETYHRCKNNNFPILELPRRVSYATLPTIHLVDMVDSYRKNEGGIISKQLKQAIFECLEKREKAMILINRRGFSTYVSCQKCGDVHTCPQCNLSYTYHDDRSFRCHRCGVLTGVTHTCRSCQSDRLSFMGTGIQKVVLELQRHFQGASIMRLDKDSAKSLKDIKKILDDFRQHGDILVGTQLIAKGHDIDTVTLVGVVGIDTILNMPDFRSSERTFQLLSQVAGRAGRGEKKGNVYIQTSHISHPIMSQVAASDFTSFYRATCDYREAFNYPPYGHLIHIVMSAKDEKNIRAYAPFVGDFLQQLHTELEGGFQYIDPKPAPIEKIRNHIRWNSIIKCQETHFLEIKEKLTSLPIPPKDLRLIIDLEPYSLL